MVPEKGKANRLELAAEFQVDSSVIERIIADISNAENDSSKSLNCHHHWIFTEYNIMLMARYYRLNGVFLSNEG
jgi:hypothetical protein